MLFFPFFLARRVFCPSPLCSLLSSGPVHYERLKRQRDERFSGRQCSVNSDRAKRSRNWAALDTSKGGWFSRALIIAPERAFDPLLSLSLFLVLSLSVLDAHVPLQREFFPPNDFSGNRRGYVGPSKSGSSGFLPAVVCVAAVLTALHVSVVHVFLYVISRKRRSHVARFSDYCKFLSTTSWLLAQLTKRKTTKFVIWRARNSRERRLI